jgi:hypothetical protein
MRPPLSLVLALCVGAAGTPAQGQQRTVQDFARTAAVDAPGSPGATTPACLTGCQGSLARSISAAAEHLAASPAPAVQPNGSSRAIDLRWQELSAVVAGQAVTVHLSDGSRLRGEALVVRDDALVMDVRDGSDANAYTGANAAIPRTAVHLIEVRRTAASSGRTLGVVIGVLTGLVVGGYITGEVANSAGVGIPLFLGLASGFTVGGYQAGRQLDTRVTTIRVVP